MPEYTLGESEFRLMEIIWDNSPISSRELSDLCEEQCSWKKTTVYTMLKRLADKGLVQNENSTVTYLVDREAVQRYQSEEIVKKNFKGSLSLFVNSFLGNRNLSKEDAAKLIDMIEEHTEE